MSNNLICKIEDKSIKNLSKYNIYFDEKEIEKSNYHQISENIFHGDEIFSCNYYKLIELNITHILTVGTMMPPYFEEKFKYKILLLEDSIDVNEIETKNLFDEGFNFIKNCIDKNENILIHCAYGISRSSAMIIYFYMKNYKMKFDDAYKFIFNKNNLIKPNEKFIEILNNIHYYR